MTVTGLAKGAIKRDWKADDVLHLHQTLTPAESPLLYSSGAITQSNRYPRNRSSPVVKSLLKPQTGIAIRVSS